MALEFSADASRELAERVLTTARALSFCSARSSCAAVNVGDLANLLRG